MYIDQQTVKVLPAPVIDLINPANLRIGENTFAPVHADVMNLDDTRILCSALSEFHIQYFYQTDKVG